MTETEAFLLLSHLPWISVSFLESVRARHFSLEQLAEDPKSLHDSFPVPLTAKAIQSIENAKDRCELPRLMDICAAGNIGLVSCFDTAYPRLLREIHDPPVLLYVKGSLIPEDEAAISVVGSRHPSPYGLRVAQRFSYELSESGVTVVSGLARGIDAAAHRGALEARGRTIAVLGCGIDVVYPKDNERLFELIREAGAIVSEFPIGTPPLAHHFPKRNRIIAGLALGVLVVEAHSRSGSLITASLAAEEGREVYAVPGEIDSLRSRGTNHLIQEGARCVVSVEEILGDLGPVLKDYAAPPKLSGIEEVEESLTEEESRLLVFFEGDSLSLDDLQIRSGMGHGILSSLIFGLEHKGILDRKPGGLYRVSSVRLKISA